MARESLSMNHARDLYFDDFKPGDRFQSETLQVSEALIVEFGLF